MYKQLIVLSSLLVGAGSAGMAMYLQANPLALSKGQRVNLETYLYSATPDRRDSEPDTKRAPIVQDGPPMIVDLPEVWVGPDRPAAVGLTVAPAKAAPKHRALQAPASPAGPGGAAQPGDAAQPSTAPRELHPCSNFREMGPSSGVRDLC